MLISSIKMAMVSLGLAPNRVLPFLLSLDYIASCVSFGFVFAEKFRKIVTILCSLFDERKGEAKDVLPTPESPVSSIGFLISSINSSMCLYFSVSIVGTIMSWYSQPFGN